MLIYLSNPNISWWAWNLPQLNYSFYFSAITIIFTIFYIKKINLNKFSYFPEYKYVLNLTFYYCIVSAFAVSKDIHLFQLEHFIKLILIFFVTIWVISDWNKIKGFMLSYSLGAMFIGMEARNRGRDMFGRVEGIGPVDLPDSNGAAAVLVPAVIFCIFFIWRAQFKWKPFMVLMFAFIANGLVLINSRGAFLATLAGSLYMLYFLTRSKLKFKFQKSYVAAALLSAPLIFVLIVDDAFLNRMNTITETRIDDHQSSGASRINYWIATFDLLKDYPFGAGIYGYQLLSPTLLSEELIAAETRKSSLRAVHSSWFQVLSEIGWFGFAIFISIIFKAFTKLKESRKILNEIFDTEAYYVVVCVESALVSYLIAISFIDGGRTVPLYLILALAFSSYAIAKRVQNEKQ